MGKARDRRRDEAKGADANATGDSGERRSLRKSKGDEARPPFWNRKRIVSWAVVALVLGTALFVWRVDGGAPQKETPGVLHVDSLKVEGWTLRVTDPDPRVLCSIAKHCNASELWAAAEANETCRLDVRVWLASALNPAILRDVDLEVNGVIRHGSPPEGEDKVSRENITTLRVKEDLRWDGGWWWRVEAERVTIRHQVPCDAERAELQVSIRATEIFGGSWSEGQPLGRIVFHEETVVTAPSLGGGDEGNGNEAGYVGVGRRPNGVSGS